jgi:hypothetical protein
VSLPFVNLQLQRGRGDCGIAALAMLLGQSYENVFAAAVTRKYRKPHEVGMYSKQIVQAARRLGTRLVLRRTWDLETSCGLLTVERLNKAVDEFSQHLVLLKFGLVFDTDGTVWEPELYFEQHGFRPVSIFMEVE